MSPVPSRTDRKPARAGRAADKAPASAGTSYNNRSQHN
jgi:hypothetical protein